MTPNLSVFFLQVALILIYFGSLTNADHKCLYCPFIPHVTIHLTANGTLNPRGCFSSPINAVHKEKYRNLKTCSWDIVQEPFEAFFDPSADVGEPTQKEWWLVPPGLVSQLHHNKNGRPNTCEKLEIPYANVPRDKKVKIIRCYCGPELCNRDYPLCKWIRKADPSWKNPLGCVEDDKFPSKRQPKLYTGLENKRTDVQEVTLKRTKRAADSKSCADDINEIFNGIKEIQKLLESL